VSTRLSSFTQRSIFVMAHGIAAHDALNNGFELSLANQQSAHAVNEKHLIDAARRVLVDSKFESARISLAVVDDATIHGLNRQFLNHDWPTDVLSFVLDAEGTHLNGEVVLSADTAARVAAEGGWTPAKEQLLYVIHGMLHLVGLDDQSEAGARNMRAAERFYLQEMGIELPEGFQRLDVADERPGGGGMEVW
jgi:probable rRNA maturation factor